MIKLSSLKQKLTSSDNSTDSHTENVSNSEEKGIFPYQNVILKIKAFIRGFSKLFYNNEYGFPSFWFLSSVYLFGRIIVGELLFPETTLAIFIGLGFLVGSFFVALKYLPTKEASSTESTDTTSSNTNKEAVHFIATPDENKEFLSSAASKINLSKSDYTWYPRVGARVNLLKERKKMWLSVSYALNIARFDPPPKNKYEPDQLPSLVPYGSQDAEAAKSMLKQTDLSLEENARGTLLWIHEPVQQYSVKEWENYKQTISDDLKIRFSELNRAINTLFPRFEFIPYSPVLDDQLKPQTEVLELNDHSDQNENIAYMKESISALQEKINSLSEELSSGGI